MDAVFVAEAFHWFDGERALAEIARVLRPRHGLALLWNVLDKPTEPSIAAALLDADRSTRHWRLEVYWTRLV